MEEIELVSRDDGYGLAFDPGSSRPPDPVNVVTGDHGEVIVDDRRELLDVETSRSNVRCDENVDLPGLELLQSGESCILGLVAVDSVGLEAAGPEILRQPIASVFRPAEHQRLLVDLLSEHMDEHLTLFPRVDRVKTMADRCRDAVLGRDLHRVGVDHEIGRDLLDLWGEGRREQPGLTLRRNCFDDCLERWKEAHVEHPIGFIEDEILDTRKRNLLLLHVIDESSRCRDEDVDTATERLNLALHVCAAEHDSTLQTEAGSIATK